MQSTPLRFGSVASGIEAASVAFEPLGWQAAWFSEIDRFPSEVLAHHYPDVPNLGDMTTLPARIASGEVEAPDVLCGGTPCQAFSVAGLRKSLDDARGQLSLTFCEIANAIDTKRAEQGKSPAIILWENVVGALNSEGNAFGCILGALAGEDSPLEPAGGKWSNAGCVFGPQRAIAWRVLDAQHFGVAQRRRRLFVVACPLERAHPTQILFELEGERRDSAPSRPTGEEATASLTASAGGVDENDAAGGLIQPYEVANCLTRRMHKGINTTLDEGHTPVLAYRVAGDGAAYETKEVTAPLMTGTDSSANVVLAYSTKLHNTKSNQSGKLYPEYTTGLERSSGPPAVVAFVKGTNPHSADEAPTFRETETAACLTGWDARHNPPKHLVVDRQVQVRKLLPVECERLMGFPSIVELEFEKMTRDEAAIICLLNRDISVDPETGKVYGHRGSRGVRLDTPREIGHLHPSGYREVKITANGVKKVVRAHRLVWISVNGPIPEGLAVDHINNDKLDNRISNLQLMTPEENSSKAHSDGCIDWDSHPITKLTAEVRTTLAHEYATTDCSYSDLATKYGVTKGRVGQIVRESGYTDVPGASDSSRYMALGNSWPIPVITWIGRRIQAAVRDREAAHG